MDELSIDRREAFAFDPKQGSDCLSIAKPAREKRQEKLTTGVYDKW